MLQKEEKAAQRASGGLQHTRGVRLQTLEKKRCFDEVARCFTLECFAKRYFDEEVGDSEAAND